jgi:hypothetical protein
VHDSGFWAVSNRSAADPLQKPYIPGILAVLGMKKGPIGPKGSAADPSEKKNLHKKYRRVPGSMDWMDIMR